MDAKEYSWAWVTVDTCVCDRPCELVCAVLVPRTQDGDISLYDGDSAGGNLIIKLESHDQTSHPFNPKEPVYCIGGLFVDIGDHVTGVFVQWRVLGYRGS